MSDKSIVRRSLLPTKKNSVVAAPTSKQQRHTFNVSIEDGALVVRMPIIHAADRKISKSGKSIICAGTGGTKVARQIEIDGKALRICATAWISCDTALTTPDTNTGEKEQNDHG
jgi:hypothetical protein